jgi:DNA-binding NarL/FixJ family response regulator
MAFMILLADDEWGIRLTIQEYLELHGYSVITAENGEEALIKLETYHPHLLVSDIRMPLMDGYELVRRMREKPRFRLIPVIFLTEKGSTGDRIEGYQAGCDAYLPKPFEMEELLAVVRNLIERSQIVQSELRFMDSETRSTRRENPPSPEPPAEETHPQNPIALGLTSREREVLILLVQGLSNPEIGARLNLSPRTIEKHVKSLYDKTETINRVTLVRYALDQKLLD